MLACVYGTNVFISGPMAGHANCNERNFMKAHVRIRECGAEHVCNPAICWMQEPGRVSERRDRESYMLESIQELTRVREDGSPFYDFVVQLDGWRRGPGAKMEAAVAEACGIPCVSIREVC